MKKGSGDAPKNAVKSPFTVQLQFFGVIGAAARTNEDAIEFPRDVTLHGLLCLLPETYGEPFRRELLDDSGGLREDVMITLNQNIIHRSNAADVVLQPGDVVALFPVFPGGG